jgi:flagellar biosynthesis regulator FlaF
MNDDERIEQALDEADEAAAATKERLTAQKLFRRIWKTLIEKQK